ncbi:hypothetical protein EDB85DRAFT_970693 [Lactarius pseudohatsudake]|nr:hypothetical protein EDB85DRAFT_970693 [Lactarius pseudohatsudake]
MESTGFLYRHPIVQQCINVIWLGDRHGEGVRFPNEFNLMPYDAVTLVLATIECCLDEWSNALQTELPFTYERYRVVILMVSIHATKHATATRCTNYGAIFTTKDGSTQVSRPWPTLPKPRVIYGRRMLVNAACQGLLVP